ncbi:uncharacterized protein LDX57_004106 [Aspergillus melleus]|uniref:uncharacterized protein n=1 Tax=Aspergillus melleus TaxID=138277 RepID=UPI001E8E6B97|nr:uncharacterized protein LDX57_004106 [Aspergillus melleus]KAH8426368.1 hypothetical protein LDX57_004106 [Aspergillus melleus]
MSESGSVEAQIFPIPTDDEERHANDMQHALKPEDIIPTAPPTPPKDRSLSADSGIALQKPQSPVTPPTDDDEENELLREVIAQCGCAPNDVEDLYACTPLQEAMVAQTMREPSAYTIEHEFYLSPEIDPKRLQNAWNQTAQANPALRTRMVATHQRGCLQVVLRGPVPWQMECDDEAVPEETTVTVWKIGAPLPIMGMISHHDHSAR